MDKLMDTTSKQQIFAAQLTQHHEHMQWVSDVKLHKFYYTNPAVETIWGISPQALLRDGQLLQQKLKAQDRDRLLHAIAQLNNSQQAMPAIHETFYITDEQQQEKCIQMEVRLIRLPADKTRYIGGYCKDITVERMREKQLAAASAKADIGNKVKSYFLTTMCHELRTPLNAILGMAQILKSCQLQAEQDEYVDIIYESGTDLLALIENLLDFSSAEAKSVNLLSIPFNLCTAIEEVVIKQTKNAVHKDIELIIDYNDKIPQEVLGDAHRIRQILSHLLSNALKFTEKGHVIISVDCLSLTQHEAELRINVQDTGIGIPQSLQHSIFDMFTQAHSTDQYCRKYDGSGLGLAICKQLVSLMQGKIGVNSEEGKGSNFWCQFTFPLQDRDDTTGHQHKNLAGLRALIIDDDSRCRNIIYKQLSYWDLQVDEVDSNHAFDVIQGAVDCNTPYQIIIIGHDPSGMNGLHMGKAIRSNSHFGNPMLVMISQIKNRLPEIDIGKAGFNAHTVKPIQPSEFIKLLSNSWENWLKVNKPSLNPAEICPRILVIDNNPLNCKIISLMLQKQNCYIEVITNGRDALQAIIQKPYSLVLMNLELPDFDGIDIAKIARQQETNERHIPLIGIAADQHTDTEANCLQAGFDELLYQPILQEDIQSLLNRWVCKRKKS